MKSRNTRQKEELTASVHSFHDFFSVDDLQEKHPKIGVATIYRFVKDLVEKGDLHSYRCEGKTIYSTGQKAHCHFYCEETQETTHFTIDSLDFLKGKIPGHIKSIQIEVRGTCKDCD